MPARRDAADARAALAEIARQRADLDRMEAALLPLVGDLVPMKTARTRMRLAEDAALKRARRGHGVKVKGRWYFRRSYVEANAR